MDSYRVEKQAAVRIQLPDADAEIGPVPATGGGRKPEPELDRLSNILKTFNDQFGNIEWGDEDRIRRLITQDIPARVRGGPGLPERAAELGPAERAHRARQSAGEGDDCRAQGRHRALQAVRRQRVVPRLARKHRVWSDLRRAEAGALTARGSDPPRLAGLKACTTIVNACHSPATACAGEARFGEYHRPASAKATAVRRSICEGGSLRRRRKAGHDVRVYVSGTK